MTSPASARPGSSWQAEADLLADGRDFLERKSAGVRYRHLYPQGPNLALLLAAYQALDRARVAGRVRTTRPRRLRRALRRDLRRRLRQDALIRDRRLLWRFPPPAREPVPGPVPALVERALAAVDPDVREDVRAWLLDARSQTPPASDQSIIDPRHTRARFERGLEQLREALVPDALADPEGLIALHPQIVEAATSPLPRKRRHPVASLVLVKLPLYLWMSLLLVLNVAYLGAFVFFNNEVLGRFVSAQVSRILQGELEIESIYWRPRMIVDFLTGQPTPLLARGVSVYEPYKGVVDPRGRKAAEADALEVELVLHEIIPWNRLGIPTVFEIPWVLHFGQVRGSDPVHLYVRTYRTRTDTGDPVVLMGLRDAFLLWDFERDPDSKGLSIALDDARLDRVSVEVDQFQLSDWGAAVKLRDAALDLRFDALEPNEPEPDRIPFGFHVEGDLERGSVVIGAHTFDLKGGRVDRLDSGRDDLPFADVGVDLATTVDGSPMHMTGALRDVFRYDDAATTAKLRADTPDVGPFARALVSKLDLAEVVVDADGQPATARITGPLADPTFHVEGEVGYADLLGEPAWAAEDLILATRIEKRPPPEHLRTPAVGPADERWVFAFDRLQGRLMEGTVTLAPPPGFVVMPALDDEPYVLAASLTLQDLDLSRVVPGDERLGPMLAGRARGGLDVERLEILPTPAPQTSEDDAAPGETGLRAELGVRDLRVRRRHGPADDGLPRRLRVDGGVLVDYDGSVRSDGLTVGAAGSRATAHGELRPSDPATVRGGGLSVDISDGPAFAAAFDLPAYFSSLQANLGLSGPLTALSGDEGALQVAGLGVPGSPSGEVTGARLWMDRGTLHVRSGRARMFGGSGSLELAVTLSRAGRFLDDPLVRATLDLEGVSIARLVGQEFSGHADLRVEVDDGNGHAVPLSKIRARAAAYAPVIGYHGHTFAGVEAQLALDPKRLSIERLSMPFHRAISPFHLPGVTIPVGQVDVAGTVSLADDPALDLEVAAAGVPLGLLSQVFDQELPIRAQIAHGTRMKVTGTVSRPAAEGTVHLEGVHVAGVELGGGELRVATQDVPREGPLAPHRELQVTGELHTQQREVDWTVDALVAMGAKGAIEATGRLYFAHLAIPHLLTAPHLADLARAIDGEVAGVSADAVSCSPGAPMLSPCMNGSRTEQSLTVGLEIDRAWLGPRPPGGTKRANPCTDADVLCSRNRLLAEVDGPIVRLREPWRLSAATGQQLALEGAIDVSSPPAPAGTRRCQDPSVPARAPTGKGRARLHGALALAPLAPLAQALGVASLDGELELDVSLLGYLAAPVLSGHVRLPQAGAATVRLDEDGAFEVALRELDLALRGESVLLSVRARAGEGDLEVGSVADRPSFYTYAGPCSGAFRVAGRGRVPGAWIDAAVGDAASVRGAVQVEQLLLAGRIPDEGAVELDRLEGALDLGAASALELEADLGLERMRTRDGRVAFARCGAEGACDGQDAPGEYSVWIGGRSAEQARLRPSRALVLDVGARGQASVWGTLVLSPDLDEITRSKLHMRMDEVTYRAYDGRGRLELIADVSSDDLLLDGGGPLLLGGGLDVDRSRWVKDALDNVGLVQFMTPDTSAPPSPPPDFVRDLQFDLNVRTVAPLRVDNNIASGLEARARVHVTGTYDAPEFRGRMDLEPSGEIRLPLISGTFQIQEGRVILEREIEDALVNLTTVREEPIYVDGQPRRFTLRLAGPLRAIRWECDTGTLDRTRSDARASDDCIDYLLFGAGDVPMPEADLQRGTGATLQYARKGLQVVGNVAELDASKQIAASVPRAAPYLPETRLRLGQLGPEVELQTPRRWFDFDYGSATLGFSYTRGYPGFLLRSNRELTFRLQVLDPFYLEARQRRRSYLNQRVVFDPLVQGSIEATFDFEVPSMR